MKRKNFSNVVFILFVVAVISIIFYLNLNQETEESYEKQDQNEFYPDEENEKPELVDWENLLPELQAEIDENLHKGMKTETARPIGIFTEEDITGDGLPEALVYLGTGGAATESLALARIEENKPVLAEFKGRSGNISFLTFLSGGGGSGRYGLDVAMRADKNALVSTSFLAYGNESDYCRAEAYEWNPQTKIFEFNQDLSDQIKKEYCASLCDSLPIEMQEYFQKICK